MRQVSTIKNPPAGVRRVFVQTTKVGLGGLLILGVWITMKLAEFGFRR